MAGTRLYEEQKKLVIARFETLNPNSKIMLGGDGEITVRELMNHIRDDDELGRNAVRVQMKMLRLLASGG